MYAIHTAGDVLATQPFLRVTVRPGEVWAVRYKLATARDLQGFEDLDSIASELPVAAMRGGRLITESGSQQEISLSHKAGGGAIEAAVYRDAIGRCGDCRSGRDECRGCGCGCWIEWSGGGYGDRQLPVSGRGVRGDRGEIAVSEPLTQNLWAALEYERAAALATGDAQGERLHSRRLPGCVRRRRTRRWPR